MGNLAVVQVRGLFGIKPKIRKTIETLNLGRKNTCIVLENNKNNISMIRIVKDYVTFGEINSKTKKKLETFSNKDDKIICHLHPPVGGFERGGVKKPYSKGGALGERDSMDDLIEKMIPDNDEKSSAKKKTKSSSSKKSTTKKKSSKNSKKLDSKKSKSSKKKSSKKKSTKKSKSKSSSKKTNSKKKSSSKSKNKKSKK